MVVITILARTRIAASDTGCTISDNGDGMWGLGEEVQSTKDQTTCDETTEVQIRLDMASNKLIYESSSVYID